MFAHSTAFAALCGFAAAFLATAAIRTFANPVEFSVTTTARPTRITATTRPSNGVCCRKHPQFFFSCFYTVLLRAATSAGLLFDDPSPIFLVCLQVPLWSPVPPACAPLKLKYALLKVSRPPNLVVSPCFVPIHLNIRSNTLFCFLLSW